MAPRRQKKKRSTVSPQLLLVLSVEGHDIALSKEELYP
jgi:hypothetical protein